MAMFTAYFDASGHPADRSPGASFYVSGFVSTADKWLAFGDVWLALLEQYSIAPPFHMTDFEAGVGQYAPFKHDEPKRTAFLLQAVQIMQRYTNKPFSVGVVIADLRRMFAVYDVPDVPEEPYPWCAIQASIFVGRWAQNRLKAGTVNASDGLEYFFERGDLHKGKFIQIARDVYKMTPKFLSKDDCVPFQLCDLLGWEHRRRLTSFVKHGGGITRPSYSALEKHLPSDAFRYTTWEGLEETCEKNGFPKRTPSNR